MLLVIFHGIQLRKHGVISIVSSYISLQKGLLANKKLKKRKHLVYTGQRENPA